MTGRSLIKQIRPTSSLASPSAEPVQTSLGRRSRSFVSRRNHREPALRRLASNGVTDQSHSPKYVRTTPAPYSSCSAVGEDCTTAADCCTGLVCPDGGGECVSLPSPVYEVQSFTRDYESSCPYGTYVAWRFFEWQSTIPTGTSIDFAVQTRELATDAWSPTIATHLATSSVTTPSGSWERGTSMSGDALSNAGYTAGKYLRVTMTFNPNSGGTAAPTLLNWRQVFDCMPAQ